MKTKEQIEEALILATANPCLAELDNSNEIMGYVHEFVSEWEKVGEDLDEKEDLTPEQNEMLDALLDKYTELIYKTINAPHSIEYTRWNSTLEWYDANGYHEHPNVTEFNTWDVTLINFADNEGYKLETKTKFIEDVCSALPFTPLNSNEAVELAQQVINGNKSVAELAECYNIYDEEWLEEVIEAARQGKTDFQGEDPALWVFDQIVNYLDEA